MSQHSKSNSNLVAGWLLVSAAAVVLAAPYRIWAGVGPSFSLFDVYLLLGLGLLAAYSVVSHRIYVGSGTVFAAIVLPAVFGIVSLYWTLSPSTSIKSVVIYVEALGAFLFAVFLGRLTGWNGMVRLYVLLPLLSILVALLSYSGSAVFSAQIPPNLEGFELALFESSYAARLSHPYIGLSNNFATVLVFFVFPLLVIGRIQYSRLATVAAYLVLIAIIATQSRGAILALFVGAVFYLRARGYSWVRIGVGATVLAVFVLVPAIAAGLELLFVDRLNATTVLARLLAYNSALGLISEGPLLGYGAGVQLGQLVGSGPASAHNFVLEQILYFGLFLGSIIVLATAGMPYWISRITVTQPAAHLCRLAVSAALLTQVVLLLSQASFEGSLLRVYLMFQVGLGVALIRESERYFSR